MSMIKKLELCGQAMISYLQQKGFPEVAMHSVKDELTQFDLDLESGNIQLDVASAKEINEKHHWCPLGFEALRQGNASIVEYANRKMKNFERLSFPHLITGNLDKLSKTMKVAEVTNENMGQFHNALNLGENVGHTLFAYITASIHGLDDIDESLNAEPGENAPSLTKKKSSLFIPLKPVNVDVKEVVSFKNLNNGIVLDEEEGHAENRKEGWDVEDMDTP